MQAKQLHLLLNCITILDPLYQLAFHMKVPMTWKVQNKNMFHNVSYGKHKKTEIFKMGVQYQYIFNPFCLYGSSIYIYPSSVVAVMWARVNASFN